MLFVTNGTPLEECRKTHLEAEERGLRKLKRHKQHGAKPGNKY